MLCCWCLRHGHRRHIARPLKKLIAALETGIVVRNTAGGLGGGLRLGRAEHDDEVASGLFQVGRARGFALRLQIEGADRRPFWQWRVEIGLEVIADGSWRRHHQGPSDQSERGSVTEFHRDLS